MFFEEFLELKNSNKIPSDCKIIKSSVVSNRCITLSKVLDSETLDEELIVVPDELKWTAYSKANGFYSSDGNFIYNYHLGTFVQYLTEDRLIPIKVHDLKNKIRKGRVTKMDNNVKDAIGSKISEIKNNIAGAGAPIATSTAFKTDKQTDLAKLEAQTKKEELKKAITSAISQVELADTKRLKAYNSTRARVLGWITDKDLQLKSRVKTVVVKDPTTKKPVLKDGAPQSVVQDIARGIPVDKTHLKTKSTLEIVQNAPGPVRFCAIKLPVSGLVPLEELRDTSKTFNIDGNAPTDYVTKFLSKKELAMTVVSLIGETVEESEETHADPSRIVVKLIGKPVTDKKTNRTENRLTPVISVENKRSLLTETNYFPRTVYKTMSVSDIKSAEDQAVANLSLFGNLFRSVAAKDISFNKLDSVEKEKIAKEGNVIKSKFFDPAVNLPLGVKGVFTKTLLTNPEIVVKEEKPTKDLKKTTLRAISYNSASDAADEHGISPFNNPKFARFLDACGGELTQAKMKELYKKSTNRQSSSSNKIELSANDAAKVYLATALGKGATGLKFNDHINENELSNIDEDLLKTINQFGARA